MSQDAAAKHGVYDDELSIVEFLRRVDRREELPLDVTVTGLDDYLAAADDPEDAAESVHDVLLDRVNFIMNQGSVIQFIVDDVESWKGGVLPIDDTDIRLMTIFGGSIDQEGVGWYTGEFNVQT
jgi:hypothetical protein